MSENTQKASVHAHDLFEALLPMLEEGHRAVFPVSGMSMWPFICHGRDQVIVTACDPSLLRVGDIILFQPLPGNYMLHRITGLQEDAFMTTGDGNCFRDGWFPRDCAKARVTHIIRNGREIDCAAPAQRFLSAVWRGLFPVRRPMLLLCKKIGTWKARIRKWLSGQKKS